MAGTLNENAVTKDTEEDVVLAPSASWNLGLEEKLKNVPREKVSHQIRIRVDDTAIVALRSSSRQVCSHRIRLE